MSCSHCEQLISQTLAETPGIARAKARLGTESVSVVYDPSVITREDIDSLIENLGYEVLPATPPAPFTGAARILGFVVLGFALFILAQAIGVQSMMGAFPQATATTGYMLLFGIGVLTSFHCIGMCGGIGLSQSLGSLDLGMPAHSAKEEKPKYKAGKTSLGSRVASIRFATVRPSLLYNAGRLLSYTVLGGVVGALGSLLSFGGSLKGAVQIVAGIFMVLMSLKMLGAFSGFKVPLRLIPAPLARRVDALKRTQTAPFVVGLLNGFMPCGPLQTMQLYALYTGSALMGALSMFLFSLGTIPLMLVLGIAGSALGRVFARRAVTAGAVVVLSMGLFMFSTGLNLSGFVNPFRVFALNGAQSEVATLQGDVQVAKSELLSGSYPDLVVQAGVPVEWNIHAADGTINGCNNRFTLADFGVEYSFVPGDNMVGFTPTEPGIYTYNCWMGMIQGTITVEGYV